MGNSGIDYVAPKYYGSSFHCPYCGSFAPQKWSNFFSVSAVNNNDVHQFMTSSHEFIKAIRDRHTVSSHVAQSIISLGCSMFKNFHPTHYYAADCQNCHNYSIWIQEKMVYPPMIVAPHAHDDMPEEATGVYEEARLIFANSPRATIALLHLVLEKLTRHFGESKGNLYMRIQKLVKYGLPEAVISNLPTMGIIPSESETHIGVIELDDSHDSGLAIKLFKLVNFIVRETITKQKEIDTMFHTPLKLIHD